MGKTQIALIYFLALSMLALSPTQSQSKEKKKDRVARDFRHADMDGDRRLSEAEWNRRGNFDALDQDGDAQLSLEEVRKMYKGHDVKKYKWPPQGMAKAAVKIDPAVKADRVEHSTLDRETLCGIGRAKKCTIASQKKRGLLETGTGPRFPGGTHCPGIDDTWAMDYASKRNKQSFHGGIDVPVAWGTPMRAVAAGSVIAKYKAHQSKRGNELVLRHSPKDTSLPVWTYSAYGHMDALGSLKIGQRVKMGQIIGPTGNSGISAMGSEQSETRRPAIHLAMFFSKSNKYGEANDTIIPENGYWLDPMAFYRGKAPFESQSVKALPDAEKSVTIPVMLENGKFIPEGTKLIWPYACEGK
ncbi:MAG: peptidoglycan DD-metalloendopeptidase family protein [Rhodospirillales bacterium]|nr:peptidoglycan DD-metalloendopeptidase family protein [Rhodospirillales bacterium]